MILQLCWGCFVPWAIYITGTTLPSAMIVHKNTCIVVGMKLNNYILYWCPGIWYRCPVMFDFDQTFWLPIPKIVIRSVVNIITLYSMYYSRTSIIRTLDYPNSRCNEKCRVKVQIVVTCPVCACAVNLCRLVATRAPAAARLPSLVLTLKEVKETQGKYSINREWD
jgi:hypothetical protein